MESYKNEFSIILGIWIVLSYFVISFLSSFLSLLKEVDYIAKVKFISPFALRFFKWKHHINVVLYTLPPKNFFVKLFPHFFDGKWSLLNF